MRRSGFTMIELIFVIVILGILAAVAIPKLMATRTDAKIAAVTQQVQSAIGEIPAYVTSKGKVTDIKDMSQVVKTMADQGKAKDVNATGAKGFNASAVTHVITKSNGRISSYVIGAQDDSGTIQNCILLDVNDTTFAVKGLSASNNAICTGVKARIKDANFTIGGSSVTF